ncbi:MAG: GH32 C-terminal domain-containing protein, partial [Ignavibacteria bacterium]|nr:GH32 C-terminal domain-containing protein [Ignavibacteria bacterium]
WMNDPCGLVFHKGIYHMFFQHISINDESLITGVPETCNYFSFIHNTNRVHWAHVKSKALIDWSSENIVLQPSSEIKSSPFTGSAVIDKNEIFLIFTRHFSCPLKQEQFSARFSNSNSPIDLNDETLLVKKPPLFGIRINLTDPKFRDPKVLLFEPNNGDESFWVMTLATGTTISFYKAALSDLNSQNWEKLSEFPVYNFLNTPFVECAELLKVPHTNGTDFSFVLTASEGYVPGTQATSAWYVIGEFDGSVFSRNANENIIRAMDYGPDFYAHQSWFNTSRPTIIAWMNNWKYAQEIPTKPWKGQYTIPRHIAIETINNELRLIQSPIDEIYRNDISQELSINQSTVSNFRLTPNISHQIFRNNSALNIPSCVIDIYIDVGSANRINFNVKSDPDTGQKTQIIWNRSSNEFTLDRSNSGTFIPPGESSFTAPANLTNNLLKIKILIDKSSVEVFLGRGEIVFSSLVFPDTENNELSLIIDNETDNTILRDLIIHEI